MSMLTIILLMILMMLVVGALCIACFFVGAKIGQVVSKDEELKIPNLDPFKAYKEHKERKEVEREAKREGIILENIEVYDGTPNGQKDVPR